MVDLPNYLGFDILVIIFLGKGLFHYVFNVPVYRVNDLLLRLVRDRLEHLVGELEVKEIA